MASLEDNIKKVLQLLVPSIQSKRSTSSQPIILGITGLQGSGKSTWASNIAKLLPSTYNLTAITVSLDDFYKTHDDLVARREQDPENKLYRTRGQPGTHDEQLAGRFFEHVRNWTDGEELRIPSFDKSRFNGEGDRVPEPDWQTVKEKVDVVVFEGWCVGFQPIAEAVVEEKRQDAERKSEPGILENITTLADHKIEHLKELNENLERYNEAFMGPPHFDFMIHLDTNDLRNVYRWRLQQEHAMIEKKGTGMSDEGVVAFVRGYMPSYELYLDGLRKGFFEKEQRETKKQVRVVLDRERGIEHVETM